MKKNVFLIIDIYLFVYLFYTSDCFYSKTFEGIRYDLCKSIIKVPPVYNGMFFCEDERVKY